MPHPSEPLSASTIHYKTQPSPLLHTLPAELRDQIYMYAYADVTPTLTEIPVSRLHEHLPSPALLYTCKQIYVEATWHFLFARWRFGREKWILVAEECTLPRGGGVEQQQGQDGGDGVNQRGKLVATEMAGGRVVRW